MSATLPSVVAISMLAAISLPKQVRAEEALPNLSGTYRCEGNETTCGWSGSSFTLTQSGSDIQIKNDKGEIGNAMEHPARSAGRPPRMQAFAARASGFRPSDQKYRKRKIASDPHAMLLRPRAKRREAMAAESVPCHDLAAR